MSYNYLSVTIAHNLSWSSHVHNLCKKARKLIGFLYRNFYKGSFSSTLLNIYISHIRPILEYCSTVWDPPASLSSLFESVQHFALKVVSKNWSASYFPLLTRFKLENLSLLRLRAKLLLYKIHHNLRFFPKKSSFPFSN